MDHHPIQCPGTFHEAERHEGFVFLIRLGQVIYYNRDCSSLGKVQSQNLWQCETRVGWERVRGTISDILDACPHRRPGFLTTGERTSDLVVQSVLPSLRPTVSSCESSNEE